MANYTFPGVYIQELSSPVHTITAAPTSIAAFVGYTMSGIDNRAQAIFSFGDFQRLYGGLASNSEVSYAVQQFYAIAGSGSQAYVVRTPMHYNSATAVVYAEVAFGPGQGGPALTFSALSSGQWANGQLLIDVDVIGLNLVAANGGDPYSFNLTVTNLTNRSTEYFPQLTLNSNAQNYVGNVVNDIDNGSQLVSVVATLPATLTSANVLPESGVIGAALAPTAVTNAPSLLETVNAAIGGSTTSTIASGDFGILMNMPNFTPTSVTAKVFSKGAPIPQTVQGLATQLQTALNAQLAVVAKGAYVTCTAAPGATAGNFSIRVNASLPNAPDIVVSFAAPAAPLGDASAGLGLNAAQATANAAHYALGSSFKNTAVITNYTSTPAAKPDALPTSTELIGDPGSFTGIYALLKIPAFNLLSIPEAARALPGSPNSADSSVNGPQIYSAAITLCDQMRAMLLLDPPPNVLTVAGAVDWKSTSIGVADPNGAAFWPRLRLIDQISNQMRTFAPSGMVAGVIARADGVNRGPWVAAAGISATLDGVQNMTYIMSDAEQGQLNPLGLNCFRNFPIYGSVLWGARTLVGADAMANQWKYLPVRRTALFLESSLYQGTQWAVFSPNDERLWAALRLNIGSFMQTYFQLGAFQGQTPADAFFVKCDSETTTQTDIDNGVVNVLVGFAPLVPAEFVVIQIQQYAGQSTS
jgi:phage tail sheath protein FI